MDEEVNRPGVEQLHHAIAGAGAGVFSALCVHPLDTVKARLQVQGKTATPKYKGIFGTLQTVVREEGLLAAYRGLGANLLGLVPTMGLYFASYDHFKSLYAKIFNSSENSPYIHSIGGASAYLTTCSITNPLWVVKIRLQTQFAKQRKEMKYRNTFHAFRTILKEEGVRGFYTGLTASCMGSLVVSVQLPGYEMLKAHFRNLHPTQPLRPEELAFSSGCSMLIAVLLTYPHEVIRSNLQVQVRGKPAKYKGIIHAFKTILKEEGIRGIYKGMGTSLTRIVPACAITFTFYEYALRFISKQHLKKVEEQEQMEREQREQFMQFLQDRRTREYYRIRTPFALVGGDMPVEIDDSDSTRPPVTTFYQSIMETVDPNLEDAFRKNSESR